MVSKKILIVDDEPNNLQLLRQILKEDYNLSFAKNGKDALAAVAKHAPDLILLDVMMPEMDGLETCRRLKSDQSTAAIPVIFVTALGDVGNESLGFEMGAVDYITKPVSAPIVRARIKTHLALVRADRLEESQRDAVYMLGEAGHYNDTDTGVHIWRMADYSRAIAKAKGWSEERYELLRLAAPMHDTGKIGIPDAILKKPGKLDAGEWGIMKQHCAIGHGILSKGHSPLSRLAAEIAFYHHEKWNGQGYPNGLHGETIPESARIVAVADVFDALAMRRPYKEAWPIDKVIDEIRRGAGSHFDPTMVEVFNDILPEIVQVKEEWDAKEALLSDGLKSA